MDRMEMFELISSLEMSFNEGKSLNNSIKVENKNEPPKLYSLFNEEDGLFIYFMDTAGGLEVIHDIENNLDLIYGWMSEECKVADTELLEWMENALIGSMFEHRLGYMIRLHRS